MKVPLCALCPLWFSLSRPGPGSRSLHLHEIRPERANRAGPTTPGRPRQNHPPQRFRSPRRKISACRFPPPCTGVSIQFEGKPAEFTSQTYTSDIDHTGALTEAIVTLPRAIAPKQTIELEIGYEGTIPQDATRLTRIGAPADVAKHSDWDQISPSFTGLRGIGYVAWYPIATEAANLSEGNSVLEETGRWKQREVAIRDENQFVPVRPRSAANRAHERQSFGGTRRQHECDYGRRSFGLP